MITSWHWELRNPQKSKFHTTLWRVKDIISNPACHDLKKLQNGWESKEVVSINSERATNPFLRIQGNFRDSHYLQQWRSEQPTKETPRGHRQFIQEVTKEPTTTFKVLPASSAWVKFKFDGSTTRKVDWTKMAPREEFKGQNFSWPKRKQ